MSTTAFPHGWTSGEALEQSIKSAMSFREYLRELHQLDGPIPAREHGTLPRDKLTQDQGISDAGVEELAAIMQRDFKELVRRSAAVFERLAPTGRKAFLPVLRALHDRADQAYQDGRWADFQDVLVVMDALLAQAQSDAPQPLSGKHWSYQAWSRVLDAEVWFVCCEKEVTQLAKQGVPRGIVYTEEELTELLSLLTANVKKLKDIQLVKLCFNATIVPVPSLNCEGSDHRKNGVQTDAPKAQQG